MGVVERLCVIVQVTSGGVVVVAVVVIRGDDGGSGRGVGSGGLAEVVEAVVDQWRRR